jgi:hypothetical protein
VPQNISGCIAAGYSFGDMVSIPSRTKNCSLLHSSGGGVKPMMMKDDDDDDDDVNAKQNNSPEYTEKFRAHSMKK